MITTRSKRGSRLPWSNGPVEGQITRLKLLKRQMFGRASVPLLERRFVLAPGRAPEQGQHPLEPSEVQARPAAASSHAPPRSSRAPTPGVTEARRGRDVAAPHRVSCQLPTIFILEALGVC